jgi:predicted dehydrogenase/acetyltransferase-like isoleucine patch superfamily enzyme
MSSERAKPDCMPDTVMTTQNPRIAVIGGGGWGRNLVRSLAKLGALEAVVDTNPETAQALAEKHSCRVLSLDETLSDPAVSAVAIAAPAGCHYGIAKRALEVGKHTFVEKPLALEVNQAKELCRIAEHLDRRLMVGHLLQYHPVFIELKRIVREGKLGRLQYLYSNRLNLGRFRREEDVMWSFAPHDISMILSLVGSEPSSVDAVGSCHLHKTIADVTMLHLAFAGDEQAHVFVSWLHPFKEQKFVVVGSEAMAVFDDTLCWESKLIVYPHKVAWQDRMPTPNKAEGIAIKVSECEPLAEECRHFLDCVRTGSTPRTDGREGVRVLSVLAKATAALIRPKPSTTAGPMADHGGQPTEPRRVSGTHIGVMIHETAYVDTNVRIGHGTKIWHFSHILSDVEIGDKCSLGQNVVIGPLVRIGNGVKIQNNVSVYERVTLEDNVFCGPSCVFTNVNNPRSAIGRKSEYRPTLVKNGASIGANATIVCGHTLGQHCFIAAGAVVASDVPDYALMAGVPARRIGWVSRAGARLGADLVCPIDGTRYKEMANGRLAPEDKPAP